MPRMNGHGKSNLFLGSSMPASVNIIKTKKKEKSMDRPAKPIHGYNIRLCTLLLVETTGRWCRSPDPRPRCLWWPDPPLQGAFPLDLPPNDSFLLDLCHWRKGGGVSVLLICGRRGNSEKRKKGREGDGKLPRCRHATTSDLDAIGGCSPLMQPNPDGVRERGHACHAAARGAPCSPHQRAEQERGRERTRGRRHCFDTTQEREGKGDGAARESWGRGRATA